MTLTWTKPEMFDRAKFEARLKRRILAKAQAMEDELKRTGIRDPEREEAAAALRAMGEGRWQEYLRNQPARPHGEPLH